MPRIQYTSQVSALSNRSNSPLQSANTDPNVYGANVGMATQQLGETIGQAGQTAFRIDQERKQQQRKLDTANSVAMFGSTWVQKELDIRNKVDANADGYNDAVREAYLNSIEEHVKNIEDDDTRMAVQTSLMADLPTIASRSAQFEFTTRAETAKLQTDTALNSLQNQISLDPTAYERLRGQGADIIDALPNYTAAAKEGMKQQWAYDSAKRRFDGMINSASSLDDIQNIETDLMHGDAKWQERLLATDRETLMNTIGSMKKSYADKAQARVKSSTSSILERQKSNPYVRVPPTELQDMQAAAKEAGDLDSMNMVARIMKNDEISKTEGQLPPAVLRARMEKDMGSPGALYPDLPTKVSEAVNVVSQETGVSASLVGRIIQREAGGEFKKSANEADIKYDFPTRILDENGNPATSAVGIGQFLKDTWLELVKDPNNAVAMGLDLNTPEDVLLSKRGDPLLATMGIALHAKRNEKQLTAALGRPVTEGEVYMAHFMGAAGAAEFLKAYQSTPSVAAAELLPEAAKANKPVFFEKGKPLTIAQVYNRISGDFATAPDKVKFDNNQFRKGMLEQAEKALKEYPIEHVANVGLFAVTPLSDADSFIARGKTSLSTANYYSIPTKEIKPFTRDEEAFIKKTISEGTADDNVSMMANIQLMGKEVATGAMKQIEQTDKVFAHSGRLFLEGSTVVAGDIIRGRKRIQDNPALLEKIGVTSSDIGDEFINATGGAVYDLKPEERQTLQDAATALYVERAATGSSNISTFDQAKYKQAVQEVLGGQGGADALAEINGEPTLLPLGIPAEMLQTAIYGMTNDDWASMSATGDPAKYADGTLVDFNDIRDELILRSVGGGQYKIMLDDGTYLLTGKSSPTGRAETFIFEPDAATMNRILTRPQRQAQAYSISTGTTILPGGEILR